jgi:hypothetical protein
MRKLLLLAFLLMFWPTSSKAVPALTQSCTDQHNSGTTGTASCTLTLGANRLLVIGGAACTNGLVNFGDTLGLAITVIEANSLNSADCGVSKLQLACAFTGAGGVDTLSFALGAFDAGISITVLEFSGTNNSCTPDGHNSANGTTGGAATISSGNFTTIGTDLIVAFGFTVPNAVSTGSGFTGGPTTFFTWLGNTLTNKSEYNLTASPGTNAGTFSDPGSDFWVVVASAFGGGASKVRHRAQVISDRYKSKPKKILREKYELGVRGRRREYPTPGTSPRPCPL